MLSTYYSLFFFFFFTVVSVFEENEENFTFKRRLVRPKRLIHPTSVHLPTQPHPAQLSLCLVQNTYRSSFVFI